MANQLPIGIGAALYRIAFVIFVIACLINLYDAYTTYVQADNQLISGIDPQDKLNEAMAYGGLAILLTLEGVSLRLYKWARAAVAQVI